MWTSDSFVTYDDAFCLLHMKYYLDCHTVFFFGGASSEAPVGEESVYFTRLVILAMSFMAPLNVSRQEISSPPWG